MNISRDLVLLIAGTLAGIIGGAIFAPPLPIVLISAFGVIVIILILYASGMFSKWFHSWMLWRRKSKKLIGIINDMGSISSTNSSWTDVEPSVWKTEIEHFIRANNLPIEVKMIKARKNLAQFVAIVNPYGGVYPEEDASKLKTLEKIFTYIGEGGIWVNVADVPGYYAYNSQVDRIFATPPAGVPDERTFRLMRPFELVPFMTKLGLQVYNVQTEQINQWDASFEPRYAIRENKILEVRRAAVVEKNVEPIVQYKELARTKELITPIFLANYGRGRCLISLPPLANNINQQSDFIKARIIRVLVNRLGQN